MPVLVGSISVWLSKKAAIKIVGETDNEPSRRSEVRH